MFLTNYYHIISILQFCVLSSNFSYNFMCVSNHRVKEKNMARWNHGNDVTRIMENKLDLNEGTFRASYLEWSTIHYHESIENVYGVYKYPFFFWQNKYPFKSMKHEHFLDYKCPNVWHALIHNTDTTSANIIILKLFFSLLSVLICQVRCQSVNNCVVFCVVVSVWNIICLPLLFVNFGDYSVFIENR
jgi:hypothetical protein